VQRSRRKNLFSVLQPAQDAYWLRSNSLDAVIYAYGTHHIPKDQRSQAVKEGARVLKRGGRFVLHDFEEEGSMSTWFQAVVNTYGKTRHDYPHFTEKEMLELAQMAELRDVKVESIPDPFVTQASTEIGALSLLAEYAIRMYGLVHLRDELNKTLDLLDHYFQGIQVQQISTELYEARILRNALVVHGTR
jgi:SAM-dependent methyltransferase